MSAKEMLEYVGEVPRLPQPCRKGLDMFVRGRLPCLEEEEKYVCVDLEKDGQEFDENQINISIDIDSIIWTTRHFVCKTSIGVYVHDASLRRQAWNCQAQPHLYQYSDSTVRV